MPHLKSFAALAGMVVSLALTQSSAAITLEEAMEKCRVQFGYQGDTEGAPKQHLAIEACARQMVRNSPPEPEPTAQGMRRRR